MERSFSLRLLLTLGATAFILGLYGNLHLYPYQKGAGIFTYYTDILYRTLGLFFFEAEKDLSVKFISAATASHEIHIFNLARILAPLTLAGALLKILSEFISPYYNRFCLRRCKNHIIIFGTGVLAQNYVKENAEKGQKISVVIPKKPKLSEFTEHQPRNVRLYIGAGDQIQTWREVSAHRASSIVLIHDDDRKNIAAMRTIARYKRTLPRPSIAMRIFETLRAKIRNARDLQLEQSTVRVFVNINDISLRQELIRQTGTFKAPRGFSFEPFSISEIAARQFFTSQNFFADTILRGHDQIHWLVFGLSPNSVSLLYQFLRVCAYPGPKDQASPFAPIWPEITLYCSADNQYLSDFKQNMGHCGKFTDFSHHDLDTKKGTVPPELHDKLGEVAPTHILISNLAGCELSMTLEIRGRLRRENVSYLPIYYSEFDDIEIDDIFKDRLSPFIHDQVQQVALLKDVCKIDLLTEHVDQLARTLHDTYLPEKEKRDPKKPSHVDWDELGETYRASNRRAAAHAKTKTEYLGLLGDMRNISAYNFSGETISEDQKEALARAEHYSWWIDHVLMGWEANVVRDDDRRHHDNMVEFDKLDERTKNFDFQQVDTVLTLLEGNVVSIRSLRPSANIGMIGHNQISTSEAEIIQQRLNDEILPELVREFPEHHLRFISPLAPGSDLIMAQCVHNFMESQPNISFEVAHIQSVGINELVSGYTERMATGNAWSQGETVPSETDARFENFEEYMKEKLVAFQKSIGAIDMRHKNPRSDCERFAYNAEYFASQPDILIAFLDQSRPNRGLAGVSTTVARSSAKQLILINPTLAKPI